MSRIRTLLSLGWVLNPRNQRNPTRERFAWARKTTALLCFSASHRLAAFILATTYVTYHPVRSYRVSVNVRQQTLLNLGRRSRRAFLLLFTAEGAEGKGILARFSRRFVEEMAQLPEGLGRLKPHKDIEKVWGTIRRLKKQSRGVALHYSIDVPTHESNR